MNHLNEDQLIQVAFDLAEPDDRQAARQHLADCGDCRDALDALKAKFAAMDVLADEVPPSEDLIQQTLANAEQKPGTEVTGDDTKPTPPLYHRRWVQYASTAAAAAIVCFLMPQGLFNTPTQKPTSKTPPVATGDAPQKPAAPFPDDRMAALSSQDTTGTRISSPPAKGEYPEGGRGFGVRIVSADEIPDEPPFAPASAIELVVLPKPDKTQVTIYNSKDLTLVRDTRKLTLKPGWNWLQFMWANTQIDPTSLSLTPLEHADKVDIELISYPARLKDIGRWLIRSEVEGAVPFEITYFASGLSWRAFYMGTMNEDETTMDLKGYVNVSNHSGQDFDNTQTRLIVGETRLTEEINYLARRLYPYGPDIVRKQYEEGYAKEITFPQNWCEIKENRMPVDGFFLGGGIAGNSDQYYYDADIKHDIKQIEKTGLSEYFLYTIEGTENLTNQWTKRLPSFDVNDIPVKSLYKYDDDRYGKQPVRFVSFKNDAEHELGETPIPEGSIKIYRNVNEAQNLSYIGGSNIKYIPVNEDIELNMGPSRLVKVEPVLIDQKTENHTFDRKGNIDGWDDIETYNVTITNTRDIPIDIEITWNMGTDSWELELNNHPGLTATPPSKGGELLNSSPPAKGEYREAGRGFDATDNLVYKKHDKNRARFTMTVPARSEKEFGHTIRKYRQKRIEAYTQKMQEQEQ